MRFLHTSDWHVGVTLGGKDRANEHAVFLEEIEGIIRNEKIDALLISGDIYDHPNPTADSEKLVFDFFRKMAESKTEVVFISGNHDSGGRIEGKARLLQLVNIHAFGIPNRNAAAKIALANGEKLCVAALPFAGDLRLLNWEETSTLDSGQQKSAFAERMKALFSILAAEHFKEDSVNVLMAHLTIDGAVFSRSERSLRMSDTWTVPAGMLPQDAAYVALGHIHKHQVMGDFPKCVYSGSPLYIDFGEEDDQKGVFVVEAFPGKPVRENFLPLSRVTQVKTARVPLKDLESATPDLQQFPGHLKVVVQLDGEDRRGRIAEEVRRSIPQTILVSVETPKREGGEGASAEIIPAHDPVETYKLYLQSQNREPTPELVEKLRALVDEAVRAPSSP